MVDGPNDTKVEDIKSSQGNEHGNYVIDKPDNMDGEEGEGNFGFLHKSKMWIDISMMVDTWMYNEVNLQKRRLGTCRLAWM